MNPDLLNGLFELAGATMTLLNVRAVYRAKGYVGITISAVVFFTAWGGWNSIIYYPSLHQWWSWAGGTVMFITNILWLSLMVRYGRIKTV